ncbi:MAG: VWA domain-containing protein [Vicinamibacterales bacterium]
MSLSLTTPSALWFLLLLPLVWVGLRFARTNFNPRQRLLQAAVRALLLAALIFAVARPVLSSRSTRQSVVFAVDVSHSVSSRAIEAAATRIDELVNELRPAHSRIVAFGLDAAVVDTTAGLRDLAAADPGAEMSLVDRSGSDLERGLAEARAELAPGHLPRIVLFSDGRQTQGDVEAAATRAAAEEIPIFVEPMSPREIADSWIESVELPDRLTAGTLTTATVVVGSGRETAARIELREGTEVLGHQDVALARGETRVPIDVSFDDAGPHAVEASLVAPGDTLEANNRLAREAFVGARSRVLYVEGTPASARYLQGALGQAGFDVEVRGPSGVPATREALDPWDVVILSDLPRTAISDQAMAGLSEWVEQAGGGLLVAGGESVFGEGSEGGPGGYRNTELERITPVTFERKDEPEVALIIVLDRSWSMAGQVMELCKSAAQAAIDVLTDDQLVGVITFNDGLNWDVTLRNVGRNRDMIRDAVSAIQPAGHTLIFPAIEQAYLALKDARARAKHVVLLSDGRSYPDDYEGLVKKMVDAKMTVSSIAVGPAADVELLTNIAKWGKGRSYVVEDAREVPQIFVKEAKNATTPAFDEKAMTPVVKAKSFLEHVDLSRMPALKGRTATVAKDAALELLATEDGDPILTFWPAGLGRTAVFASDVKDRWAADWVTWKGYGPFFASVVHALERQRQPAVSLGVVEGAVRGGGRPVTVTVEARDENGNYRDLLTPVVQVRAAGGASADVPARQLAPGRYEASVTADASQLLRISLEGQDDPALSRLVIPDTSREYRFGAPDEARLRAVADLTGGAWQPDAAAFNAAAAAGRTARRALWPGLVFFALGLWLADILLRRVRVFET